MGCAGVARVVGTPRTSELGHDEGVCSLTLGFRRVQAIGLGVRVPEVVRVAMAFAAAWVKRLLMPQRSCALACTSKTLRVEPPSGLGVRDHLPSATASKMRVPRPGDVVAE